MPIIWREEMSIGNDLIDQDHRYLICLFNSIEFSLSHEKKDELLPEFFKQLVDYTIYHFDREEKIQINMKYPGHYEHKKEHQEIIAQLKEVNDELQGDQPEYRKDLINLIRKWVVEHLIVADKALSPQLKKLPRNFR